SSRLSLLHSPIADHTNTHSRINTTVRLPEQTPAAHLQIIHSKHSPERERAQGEELQDAALSVEVLQGSRPRRRSGPSIQITAR
ncbi:hypothetical protein EJB05_45311, partial [Eragrostis curvula]